MDEVEDGGEVPYELIPDDERTLLPKGGSSALRAPTPAVRVITPEPNPTEVDNPFRAQALAEANEDAIAGIYRDEKWLQKRSKALFDKAHEEAEAKQEMDPFVPRRQLGSVFRQAANGYLDQETNQIVNDIIAVRVAKAVEDDRKERPLSEAMEEQVQKRTKDEIEKVKAEYHNRSVTSTMATIRMIKSFFLCILIPILNAVLPEHWNRSRCSP